MMCCNAYSFEVSHISGTQKEPLGLQKGHSTMIKEFQVAIGRVIVCIPGL